MKHVYLKIRSNAIKITNLLKYVKRNDRQNHFEICYRATNEFKKLIEW